MLYATSGSEFAAAIAIGNGQTWQNVASQRVNGLTYTNIQGRPITISLSGTILGATSSASLTVNGVTVQAPSWNGATWSAPLFMEAIVPPGGTYSWSVPTSITATELS